MVESRIQEAIISEMGKVLSDRRYIWRESALTTIVKKVLNAKSNLIELLSKHPLWNSEKLMIQFDTDMERAINLEVLHFFTCWLRNKVDGDYKYYVSEQSREYRIINFIRYNVRTQFFDEDMKSSIDEINKLNENFKLRTNMKASKAIGKICREEGWDKLEGFNTEYAKVCDALNPIKVKRHTVISVNPIDFLLMSNGNSWTSCHDIGKADDCGCYSSGTISYMLDTHSFLFYTVDASYDGNSIELEPKIQRQVFGYNDEVLAQLRLYPQSNDSGAERVYDDIRAIVQKVVADCLGKPNMWIKSKSDTEDVVEHGCDATCYPDWADDNPGAEHCSISTLKERAKGKENRCIVFGAEPICIYCGCSHYCEGYISCCDGYEEDEEEDDYEICYSCGAIIYEHEQYYVNGHYYCGNCVTSCEECGEYIPNDEINKIDGIDVCDDCIEHSGNYFACENCGVIHFYEDMTYTEEGHYYCSDCSDEHTFECEKCGCTFEKFNGEYDEQTRHMYCEECHDEILEEREENELEEVS